MLNSFFCSFLIILICVNRCTVGICDWSRKSSTLKAAFLDQSELYPVCWDLRKCSTLLHFFLMLLYNRHYVNWKQR